MAIRDTTIVAIEGTHATGKTTLVHALTAHYRLRSVNVVCSGEPARTSPFIEEIVLHGKGSFDLATEVDLFAAQLQHQLRVARHHQLAIFDKTIANVLGYARLVLDTPDGSIEQGVLDAMAAFCHAWAPVYDAVFYLHDRYDAHTATDPLRARVLDLQDATDHAVRTACTDSGISLIDVPTGLDLDARVQWVAERLTDLRMIRG
jgi:predicted ATPase